MSHKYFGTDGIRGKANVDPITADMALRIGQAAGQVIGEMIPEGRPTVVIGKDTRLSGYMIESALQAGFTSVGFFCLLVGPMPTPAVAMLTRSLRADLGVMITASHNPYDDNGIKLFKPNGTKLNGDFIKKIEALIDDPSKIKLAAPEQIGKALRIDDAVGRYIESCKRAVPKYFDLDGMKVVVDCAHGATYHIAPKTFWELGAKVIRLGTEPDGFNINKGCGALHPETMREAVLENKADIGVALDGDGDRLFLCDAEGNIMDGDQILAAMATFMKERGKLKGNAVVGTVMTNMGCEKYLNSLGLELIRTSVGDHHVEAAMRDGGYNLGAESSGHVIFSDHIPTGDGLLAALQFVAAMDTTGKTAAEMGRLFKPFPQKLENVRLPEGVLAEDILGANDVKACIEEVETNLNGNGRILIRESGTEPLIRVMVEAEEGVEVAPHVSAIVKTMEEKVSTR